MTYLIILKNPINIMLFIVHSLNCNIPFEQSNYSNRRVSELISAAHGMVAASIASSFLPSSINDVDNAFCKIFLLDVQKNKCLISTQIYGDDGEDIGDNIIEAIGYFNEKTVEVGPCFE